MHLGFPHVTLAPLASAVVMPTIKACSMQGHAEVAFEYVGLDESEAYVSHVLATQGPFDGIMGFSQGCLMASSLIAMQHHGTALQVINTPTRLPTAFYRQHLWIHATLP